MTNQEIKDTGLLIRNEQHIGGNTALRVGGVIEGIGYALDNKDAANGYYQATINGGSISVNAPNYVLGTVGNLRIKMLAAGTTASTLTIGNANAVQLWYNGAAVSAQNTWEADEIISVFYDGTRFMASNSQGGGGAADKISYDNSQSGLAADDVQSAVDELAQNGDLYEECLANCIHEGGSSSTVTKTISNTNLVNYNPNWAVSLQTRLILTRDALVDVRGYASVRLEVDVNVSSDANIVNYTLQMYDANKTNLTALDLGWKAIASVRYIEIDLTSSTYSNVAYVSPYFGASGSASISASSINDSALRFILARASRYTTKAVDEEMLEDAVENADVLVSKITDYSGEIYISAVKRYNAWYKVPKGLLKIKLTANPSSTYHYGIKFVDLTTETVLKNGATYGDSGWINYGAAEFIVYNTHEYVDITFGLRNNGAFSVAAAHTEMASMTFSVEEVKEDYCSLFMGGIPTVAHRGTFFVGLPENSLPAFRLARMLGYKYIECDVRVTSDGGYVIMHDASINRTCVNADNTAISSTVNVASTTLSVLRSNYVLKSENPAYRTPIPTLEEYLVACKGSDSIAMIELEPLTNEQVQEVYDLCVSILGKGNFCFNSGNYGELDYVRTIDSDVDLFYEMQPIINTTNTIDGRSRNDVHNAWYAEYSGSYGTLNASVISQYHALGMKVFAWTVPSAQLESLVAMGIDGVATNDIPMQVLGATATCEKFDIFNTDVMTNGTINNGVLSLSNGQFLQLPNHNNGTGVKCIRIAAKGAYTITTNTKTYASSTATAQSAFTKTFNDAVITEHELYMMYYWDIPIASGSTSMPNLLITAGGEVEVYSVEYYDVGI